MPAPDEAKADATPSDHIAWCPALCLVTDQSPVKLLSS